jgi:hypothetical protein
MCFILLVAAVFLTESPKFKYAIIEFKKAIKLISGLNKSCQSYEQIDNIIFDSEAYLYQKDSPEDLDKEDSIISATNINGSIATEEEIVQEIENKPLIEQQ